MVRLHLLVCSCMSTTSPYLAILSFSWLFWLLACCYSTMTYMVGANVYYGVDVSYPIHSFEGVSTNYPWLPHNIDPYNHPTPPEYNDMPIQPLGNRQEFYERHMQGCRDFWDAAGQENGYLCDKIEGQRIQQCREQPISMVNYTDVGYTKVKTPEAVFTLIQEFWHNNKHNEKEEEWLDGNVFVNYWENPSVMVDLTNSDLEGGGMELKKSIWESTKDIVQDWTGENLVPSSLYGIRVYKEGAVLATHVDRNPLISSVIINVDQDVDEVWPIEVIGHDGLARNITMEPGDMILYESHSINHARPFPLKGRFYANIFIHFEPDPSEVSGNLLPAYILEGSIYADNWYETQAENDNGNFIENVEVNEAHVAAHHGDIDMLMKIAMEDEDALHIRDNNGWMPIHEGARSGHFDVLTMLLNHGADINARTHNRHGHSPLSIALHFLDNKHPIVDFLRSEGAVDISPDEL